MRRFIGASLVLLTLAGCGDLDPYRRDGMWQPEGTAYGNLAQEVVNPADLAVGRGSDETSGDRAAKAVQAYIKEGPGGSPSLTPSAGGFSAGQGGAATSGGGASGGGSAGGS
jgi:hypothetical protein